MITSDTLVKFTWAGRRAPQTGFVWPEPGVWARPVEGPLRRCSNGYHVAKVADCIPYINEDCWLIEVRGEQEQHGPELVTREARLVRHVETWNERTARLWAVDCASRGWPFYYRAYPEDRRPLDALRVARRYARGEASRDELDAAVGAARAASRAAVVAARDVCWAMATATAWAAVGYTARDTERAWQIQRLLRYLNGEIG